MSGSVQVWQARLSEGFCPREGHPALQVRTDPGGAGYGYCHDCQVWWRQEDQLMPSVGVMSFDPITRFYRTLVIDLGGFFNASREVVVMILDRAAVEVRGGRGASVFDTAATSE